MSPKQNRSSSSNTKNIHDPRNNSTNKSRRNNKRFTFAYLKPRVRHVSERTIKSKWTTLPESMQARIGDIFKSLEHPVIVRERNERKRIEAQAAVHAVVRKYAIYLWFPFLLLVWLGLYIYGIWACYGFFALFFLYGIDLFFFEVFGNGFLHCPFLPLRTGRISNTKSCLMNTYVTLSVNPSSFHNLRRIANLHWLLHTTNSTDWPAFSGDPVIHLQGQHWPPQGGSRQGRVASCKRDKTITRGAEKCQGCRIREKTSDEERKREGHKAIGSIWLQTIVADFSFWLSWQEHPTLRRLDDLARNSQDSDSRPADYAFPNAESRLAMLCEVNAPFSLSLLYIYTFFFFF